jgi:hypothetical protein
VSSNAAVSSKLSHRARTLSQRRHRRGVDLADQDVPLKGRDREGRDWVPASEHERYEREEEEGEEEEGEDGEEDGEELTGINGSGGGEVDRRGRERVEGEGRGIVIA